MSNLPDWERVETDYRIGTKSLREIAEDQGLEVTAVKAACAFPWLPPPRLSPPSLVSGALARKW